MYTQLLFSAVVGVFALTALAPQVNAQSDFSQVLKRMDAIITEMQSLRDEFASLNAAMEKVSKPAVLGATAEDVLGDDIRFGSTNTDIEKIQKLFATDITIYPYGVSSGFFGPKTQDAVRSFQARFGLDTVGVVGPSTRSLLEVFFAAYPDGDYPSDVLQKPKPSIKKKHTTVTTNSVLGALRSIKVTDDDGEYIVRSSRINGTRNRDLILYPKSLRSLVEMIANKLSVSKTEVNRLLDMDEFGTDKKKKKKIRKGDAREEVDDADELLDKARAKIKDAENDDDPVEKAEKYYKKARAYYKDAKKALRDKEYEDAFEAAEDSQKNARKAIKSL